ncbi:MAG: cytochrome c family protein, partial [Alphaproteobacteria bacterium]|nr:cytochrome c family protein [Alphaproteobacteria bacterium]
MTVRRRTRLALFAALPLLAATACSGDTREPRAAAPPDPAAEAATRLRDAIEQATFTPPAPAPAAPQDGDAPDG